MNQTRRERKQLELRLGGGGREGEEEEEEEEELGQEAVVVVEKEHMFDKVVTPSDVGKLNRLVIPKQHAEKYFPLDSSSNEKGLLLNFEDHNGKLWRFRYSYWNSSQSYVMTKGWSRFVKDKKLDAGDVVSFHRGVGELYRHRLYIDWRPRSHHQYYLHHPSNSIFTLPNYFLPTHNYNNNCANARSSLYSSSNPHPYPSPYPHPHPRHHPNYNINNNFYTLHQHQQYPPHPHHNYYNLTSPTPPHHQEADRMIIDSVPIAHHHHPLITAAPAPAVTPTTPGKRLRLFGINMECASSSTTHVPLPLPSSTPRFGDPRGETSLHPSSHSPHSSAQ